jgi:hypothetical protein
MGDTDEITSGQNSKLDHARERYIKLKDCKFESEWRKQAELDIKYFTGEDQGWDEDGARAKLKDEERPALTLNRVNPIIRLMTGARPPVETKYFAVEEGDTETAAILNSCKDHIETTNRWEFASDDAFLRFTVMNRMVIEIRPDYTSDPRGDVQLVIRDGFDFYFDPNSKEKDRSDMEDMFEIIHCTPDQAKRAFPKKKAKLTELVGNVQEGNTSADSRDSGRADEYSDTRSDYYDSATNKLTIARYWFKTYEKQTKIIDSMFGEVWDSPKDADEVKGEIEKLSSAPERFVIHETEITRVRYITFIYDTVLEEGVNPWERPDGIPTKLSQSFPFVIGEPERIIAGARNELISIINPLQDPQKFHNKLASAILEIIGTSPKTGIDYEKGAMSDENSKKLKKAGAKAGAALEWEPGALSGSKVHWRTSTSNPQAEMMEAKEMIKELMDISGVESLISTESLGKGASGFAIDLKQRQGSNIISWVFRSFRFFNHILAEFERDAIQVLYDYEKVIRIRGSKPKYITINEQIYDEQGSITQVLNDVTTGKYDVTISDKEIMPTMRLERFRYFTELVKGGALPLPPEVMVKIILHLLDDPELKSIVEEEMATFQQMMAGMQGGGLPGGVPGGAPGGAPMPGQPPMAPPNAQGAI